MLFHNQLDVLSPRRGFFLLTCSLPGVYTPVCVFSHLDLHRPLVRCLSNRQQKIFSPRCSEDITKRGPPPCFDAQNPRKHEKGVDKQRVRGAKSTKNSKIANNFSLFTFHFSLFVVPLRRHYELMAHFKPILKV